MEITPISIKSIGYRTYIYFAVFNACFIPLIYFFYPESAGLTLENIDYLFTGEKVLLHYPEVSTGQTDIQAFLTISFRQGLQGHRHGLEGAEPTRLNEFNEKDEKAGLEYVEDQRA